MKYFKITATGGYEYVRVDVEALRAEYFDPQSGSWLEDNNLADEIVYNGGGEEITIAEVMKALI